MRRAIRATPIRRVRATCRVPFGLKPVTAATAVMMTAAILRAHREELAWIDAHVDGAPYGVDVLVPDSARVGVSQQTDSARAALAPQRMRTVAESRIDLPEALPPSRQTICPRPTSIVRSKCTWSGSATSVRSGAQLWGRNHTDSIVGGAGAKPFIEVGKPIKTGDTLLIVEAMKVMNPITAPSGGFWPAGSSGG